MVGMVFAQGVASLLPVAVERQKVDGPSGYRGQSEPKRKNCRSEEGSLTDVSQGVIGSQPLRDDIAHVRWRSLRTDDVQQVCDQACDSGSSHRCTGDSLVLAIVPGGCNVGPGSKDVDDRSIVGVPRPAISDIRCTDSDGLGSVGRAGILGVHVGVTL